MTATSMALLGFLSGSIPFSVILGKLFLREDVRDYGDGNPGGANAWRAGGAALGITTILLDLGKAFVPVFLAVAVYEFHGFALFIAAAAPVLGHAFSPFLRFNGGKAIASTYGTWLALTGWGGPLVMAVTSAAFYLLQTVDAWTVICGLVALFVYLLLINADVPILLIFGLNFFVVAYKHVRELRSFIRPRTGLTALLRRK